MANASALVSDTFKCLLLVIAAALGLSQTVRVMNSKNKTLLWMTLGGIVFTFIAYAGEHEPIVLPWEIVATCYALSSAQVFLTGFYLAHVIAEASYRAVDLEPDIPSCAKYAAYIMLILFLAAQVVSIILALGTNKIKFFAIRVAANATLTTFLICVFEYSMSRLLIEATKSYNRNYGDDNSKKNLDAKPIAESKYDINKSNSLQGKNSKLDLNKDRNAINPFQNCPNVEPKIQIKVSDSVQKMPNPSVREVVKDNLKNSTRDFQKCLQLSSKNLSFKYKHGESETESCDEKDSMEHRITVDKIRFARTFSEGGEASEEQKQLESGEAKSIQSLRHPSKSQNRSLELYNSSPGVMSLNSSLPFGNSTRKAMVRADEQTKRMGSLGIQVQEKQSKSTYFERKAKRQAKDKNTIRKLSFTIW
eukprot:CAMPEP_0184485312 /NCGR_PEP_ID=MMETSP0113_2-20130426/6938_1 /TAXON_ID=91329 /ORGANISM="Norrisiella sphaerica, Strain BC52" /LENGTH=419 /DNA_ID=CAMNT_0026866707 /DNA_START=1052 /DNA_END=2308 /DNA_ORIENTATION=+